MKIDPKKIAGQHKFCFKCGGDLTWQEGKLLICQKCGFRNFLNSSPVNAAILENEKGKILLVKRKADPKKGYWDLPGGFVDFNENAEESTIREIREELDVEISDLAYFCSEYDSYLYDGANYPTIGLIFTGKIGDQKIKISDDVSGYKFFKKEELPFEKIAFEGLKDALKKYVDL